jgi:hypothetical protein
VFGSFRFFILPLYFLYYFFLQGESVSSGQTKSSAFSEMEKEDVKINNDEDLAKYIHSHPQVVHRRSQIVKLLEKRKGNLFADLQTINQFSLKQDTWDSLLIPAEPDPAFFDTFQDYEQAMLRWTTLYHKAILPSAPCHASQLTSLIPIHVPEVEQKSETDDENVETVEEETEEGHQVTRAGMVERSFLSVSERIQRA